jgi:uncharacterized protein YdcH (DUF465 family)
MGYHFPNEQRRSPSWWKNDSSVAPSFFNLSRLKGDHPDMDMTNTDSLKEQLMQSDPEFRELAREHGRYEERLSQLTALAYPSDEEQLEEVTLKKKKLAVKDQMHAIMLRHQQPESTAH